MTRLLLWSIWIKRKKLRMKREEMTKQDKAEAEKRWKKMMKAWRFSQKEMVKIQTMHPALTCQNVS